MLHRPPTDLYGWLHYVRDLNSYATRQAIRGKLASSRPRTEVVFRSVLFRAVTL